MMLMVSGRQESKLPQQQQRYDLDIQQQQETRCLSCIRSVSSQGIDLAKRCEGYYCGPYQINYQYWAAAGKPGSSQGTRDFEKCARDKQCAESTVRAYFKKFKRDCNNDGIIDCLDMAALHKGGPQSCSLDWFHKSRYWQAFNKTTCATTRDTISSNATQLQSGSSSNNRNNNLDQQSNRQQQQPQVIMKNQTLTSECLDCICEALTSCSSSHSLAANNCGSGTVCGPFAISQQYWKDGRRPGASWTACARTKECSSVTIRNYMDKHKRDCNSDGFVTCEDYAAIHRRGPKSCMNRDLLKEQFWLRFLACRANQKPNNDANLVKVEEDDSAQQILATSLLASRGGTTTTTTTTTTMTIPNGVGGSGGSAGSAATSTTQQIVASSVTTPATPLATLTPAPVGVSTSTSRYQHKDHASNNKHLHQQQHPSQPIYNRYQPSQVYEPLKSVSVSASSSSSSSWPTSSTTVGHIPSSIAYEDLNPIHIEIKREPTHISNSQVKPAAAAASAAATTTAHQTGKPLTQAVSAQTTTTTTAFIPTYSQNVTPLETSLPHQTTLTRGPSASQQQQQQQQTTRVYQEYPDSHTTADQQQPYHQQARPLSQEYGSLPTIIVSKPLGSVSANRVSQAPPAPQPVYLSPVPQESYADSQTPPPAQTTTSMTTTTMSPASALSMTTTTTSYPSSELETVATTIAITQFSTAGGAGGGAGVQDEASSGPHLAPDYAGSAQDDSSGSSLDNVVPDFESSGAASSFDRVVNGIVGSPDFSKAYPPMPELVQQRKQQQQPPPPPAPSPVRGPASLPRASSPGAAAAAQSSSGPTSAPSTSSTSALVSASGNKRENSKTLSPNIYAVSGGGGGGDASSAHQVDPASVLLGPDALNMTSLFQNGGLNETSRIASECLDCICDASSNCDTTVQCISKQREKNRCGMYMISWNQYKESDISLTSFITLPASSSSSSSSSASSSSSSSSDHQSGDDYDEKLYFECSTDKNCAEKLIHLYIEKYSKDCNHDGKIDCYDIAAIHRVGPDNCNSHKFLGSQYWRDFNHCYATDRLTTTTTQASTVQSLQASSLQSQGVAS